MANNIAVATYKFDAKQPGDLSFEVGDYITVLQKSNTGWWTGRTQDGRQGIFPFNRVKLVEQNKGGSPTSPMPTGFNNTKFVLDRINTLRVHSEPSKTQPLTFSIELQLSNSNNVTGNKTMKDFRILNNAFNLLSSTTQSANGAFYKRTTTETEQYDLASPEWADEMPLERTQIAQRARQLQQYMESAMGDEQMEYMMVYWLNPSSVFSITETKKNTVKEIFMQAVQTAKSQGNNSRAVPTLVRAAYDWVQRDDQEINLTKNEVIAVLEKNTMFNGWWMGQKTNGKTGVFPYNYVQEIPQDIAEKLVNPQGGASPVALMAPPQTPKKFAEPSFTNIPSGRIDVKTLAKASKTGRNRKRITKYSLCCTEAFDELLQQGVSIEENGRLAKFAGRTNTPKTGDTVKLFYSAYIWEPQKQELLEFASSDLLLGGANQDSHGPLEFTMGQEQAIEGVEEAVSRMEQGQTVRVTLTPARGYGDVGFPPDIPGNAYLVYDLTLEEITKNTASVKPNGGAAKKSKVANRRTSQPFTGFQGFKSIQNLREESQREVQKKNKKQMQHMLGNAPAAASNAPVGPVDSEAFKKKLTLKKLQEIVRKRQFEEYGILQGIMEEYLTEEEFTKAFNVDHFTWLLMPAFRRKQLKQELQLF